MPLKSVPSLIVRTRGGRLILPERERLAAMDADGGPVREMPLEGRLNRAGSYQTRMPEQSEGAEAVDR